MSPSPSAPRTSVELVRHAHAASRDQWWGRPDRDRPLTTKGRDQAKALGELLEDIGEVAGIWSSPTVRCVDTMVPLAGAVGREVEEADTLAEAHGVPVLDGGDAWVTAAWLGGRALGTLDALVARFPGQRLVLCSHGDVIPALLACLAGRDGLDLTDVRCAKGGRFSLTFMEGRCVAAVPHGPPTTG